MEKNERYEVNQAGQLVVGEPTTLSPSDRKGFIEKMFSINGWQYTLLEEISGSHFRIRLSNPNLNVSKELHLYHGNIRKEDPERNREEKKIQLGTDNDPRDYFDNAIILGFYVYGVVQNLDDLIVVAWPIEKEKNYPMNPSLRVNMRTDILPAKNRGYYVDETTGKHLIAFRPSFIYYYLENYKRIQYPEINHGQSADELDALSIETTRLRCGRNILLYGVPGSGKSWTIEHEYVKPTSKVERLVFHPDYTYSDFVGQILPCVDEDKQVTYKFTPGPFTNILREAYLHPQDEYILVIEEINRGNAPAIFGEIFQLLDRKVNNEGSSNNYPIGTSEYGITNAYIAKEVYDDPDHKVRIPSNLSIIGTMNTSDQNVFTLDTAFQRRWQMRLIENNFENVDPSFANMPILDTTLTWQKFCTEINKIIIGNGARTTSSEDKRLGAYFILKSDLVFDNNMGDLNDGTYDTLRKKESMNTITEEEKAQLATIRSAMMQNRRFPEKVIKYLWDDAFKFNQEVIFDKAQYHSLEDIIRAFLYSSGRDRLNIFSESVRGTFFNTEA